MLATVITAISEFLTDIPIISKFLTNFIALFKKTEAQQEASIQQNIDAEQNTIDKTGRPE